MKGALRVLPKQVGLSFTHSQTIPEEAHDLFRILIVLCLEESISAPGFLQQNELFECDAFRKEALTVAEIFKCGHQQRCCARRFKNQNEHQYQYTYLVEASH